MIIKTILEDGYHTLKQANINSAKLDASVLLAHVIKKDKLFLITSCDNQLTQQQIQEFNHLITRRTLHEPVAKIIGYKEFWGINFHTNKYTLDPRPDSEVIIESVLQYYPDKAQNINILDIGTGTGCLILSILSEYKNASGIAIDKSDKALHIARHNAQQLNFSHMVQFIKSDWFTCLPNNTYFDVIISNPPYITPQEYNNLAPSLNYDPKQALISESDDGLAAYKIIAQHATKFLHNNGYVILEIGHNMETEVTKIMHDHQLTNMAWRKDISQITRCGIFQQNC